MTTPDRNKTQTTREITAAVITWLDNHGFKPLETECFVERGWQADIATMIDPTRGEASALKLIPSRRNEPECEALFTALPSPITALVEVKASVSDLKQDRKWLAATPTNLRIVAVPSELVSLAIATVPAPWGVFMVRRETDVQPDLLPDQPKRGKQPPSNLVRVMRWPGLELVSVAQHLAVVYEVALRRDHRTRYAALREAQKQARVRDNQERETPHRWSTVMNTVKKIVKGGYGPGGVQWYKSVEEVLALNHVTGLPEWQIAELKEMWGIAAPGTAAATGDMISTMGPAAESDGASSS